MENLKLVHLLLAALSILAGLFVFFQVRDLLRTRGKNPHGYFPFGQSIETNDEVVKRSISNIILTTVVLLLIVGLVLLSSCSRPTAIPPHPHPQISHIVSGTVVDCWSKTIPSSSREKIKKIYIAPNEGRMAWHKYEWPFMLEKGQTSVLVLLIKTDEFNYPLDFELPIPYKEVKTEGQCKRYTDKKVTLKWKWVKSPSGTYFRWVEKIK